MVLAVVNRVDANGVDAKLLKKADVVAKGVEIEERVCGIRCTAWLVCYTTYIKAGVASPEGVASDLDLFVVRSIGQIQKEGAGHTGSIEPPPVLFDWRSTRPNALDAKATAATAAVWKGLIVMILTFYSRKVSDVKETNVTAMQLVTQGKDRK